MNEGAPSCPLVGSDAPMSVDGWTYEGCFKESASTNLINQGVLEVDLDQNSNPARACAEYLAKNVPSANIMGIQQVYPLENGIKPSKVHCYYATDPSHKQYSTLGCETDASACNIHLPGRANLVYTRAHDPTKHKYKQHVPPGVSPAAMDPPMVFSPAMSPGPVPGPVPSPSSS